MNIESYNLDSLRELVRKLQIENSELKAILDKQGVLYEPKDIFDESVEEAEAYDPDQGGRIISKWITDEMVIRFYSMFWGREDVYAKRGRNGGYFGEEYQRQTS